ncbi:MAG: metallophosphoesterase family protein [Selenomonadaceae bacterium]
MTKTKKLSRRSFLKSAALGGLALATATIIDPFSFSNRVAAAGLIIGRDMQPLWKANNYKNKIVVVSDLHFGIDDSFAEDVDNRKLFVEFLQKLQQTSDVRELVIAGDFLDEWFLPLNYGPITDLSDFFIQVALHNQIVMNELNNVMKAGIKLVYVIGNHDMTMATGILSSLLPGIVEMHDAKGLGRYITGDRNEIVIEHCHRYDPYSAPDTVSNRELCNSDATMYPPGYFYARIGTSWVVDGRPKIKNNYPVLTNVPTATNTDQRGAYAYAKTLESLFSKIIGNHGFDEKVFRLQTCGFHDSYSLNDMRPIEQADGTISAPVLFRNFQRSWDKRQELNGIEVKIPFLEANASAVRTKDYFYDCARKQYLDRRDISYDVVVFGHTHIPDLQQDGKKLYVNSGTWVDTNASYPAATRTFAVVETGTTDNASLYEYRKDGSLADLSLTIKNK